MTISPEALEKARSLVANYGSDPDGLLVGAIAAEIAALKKEAAAFAEKVQDYSNDGHIARAARSFLDKWEGRDG
jgi:cell division protein FtsB